MTQVQKNSFYLEIQKFGLNPNEWIYDFDVQKGKMKVFCKEDEKLYFVGKFRVAENSVRVKKLRLIELL